MLPTSELLKSSTLAHIAAWQWRFSVPLLMLIVMLLGIPLSETNLRRGRYTTLFPSIVLYLIYLVLLNAAKGALEEGKLSPNLGLWWVHAVFFLLALVLWIDKRLWANRLGFG
jgi:lipopolysaccharide export system permease protein